MGTHINFRTAAVADVRLLGGNLKMAKNRSLTWQDDESLVDLPWYTAMHDRRMAIASSQPIAAVPEWIALSDYALSNAASPTGLHSTCAAVGY